MMKKIPAPTRKTIFYFGLTILIGFGIIGFAVFKKGHPPVAFGLWGGAALVALISFISPTLATPLYRGWMMLGMALGLVTSQIVLSLFYFLLFTPVAVFFRLKGRDELKRRKSNTETYWVEHPVIEDKKYYEHIF